MYASISVIFPLLVGLLVMEVRAGQCNITTPCASAAPCCSEFGFCGDDHFCLGGCNPLASHSMDSCRPEPLCKDANYVFPDNSRILTNSTYFDGNATQYDWVVEHGNVINTNSTGGELVLILTEENGGTRISSTRYVHYGTITAKLKTGRWNGVVTAFITMSDIKDEIDWEFPGASITEGQTNFFWQGVVPEKTIGETHGNLQDTFANYHDYTIDWQPETLTFSIDGNVVRTINAADFEQGGVRRYPNTPSRIQLSLWPAGVDSFAAGTVAWAGGMIDWSNSDYQAAGHFYAMVKSVSVKCTDPQKPGVNMTGYIYSGNATANPSVAFTNASTLLNGAGPAKGVAMNFSGVIALTTALLVTLAIV